MFWYKKITIISMCFFISSCEPFLPNFYGSSLRIGDQPREEVFIEEFIRNPEEREKEIKACQKIPERKRINYLCSLAIDTDRLLKGLPLLYMKREVDYKVMGISPPFHN